MYNVYPKFDYSTAFAWWLAFVLICCTATFLHAQETTETRSLQEHTLAETSQTAGVIPTIKPIQTDSPLGTLQSFLRLRDELEQTLLSYRLNKSRELAEKLQVINSQLSALLDLSSIPPLSRRDIGIDTNAYLLDILGRVKLPNLKSIPDEEAFDKDGSPAKWRIPGTPIWIVQVNKGAREGEFLFGENTIMEAPRFYQGIKDLPLQTSLPIISWHRAIPQFTGPMIPALVLRNVPQSLQDLWLDTPKWKVISVVLISTLATLLLFLSPCGQPPRNRKSGRLPAASCPDTNRDLHRALEPKGFY